MLFRSVFAKIPGAIVDKLHQQGWRFYNDVGPDRAARLMCSWDTAEEDVSQFVEELKKESKEYKEFEEYKE